MATANKKPESNVFKNSVQSLSHKRIRTIRLISQIAFFFLVNGAILGLSKIPFPAPIDFPAGAHFGTIWGGFDAIQYIMHEGQFPFLAFGIFFITGITIGKMTCGWVCPVGLWQDIISWFPSKKIKVSKPLNKDLQDIAGFFLWAAIILTAYIGIQNSLSGGRIIESIWTSIPYAFFDPGGTIFVTWFYAFFWKILPGQSGSTWGSTTNALGSLFFWKSIILLVITFVSLKVPRAYCRWMCPTGALLGYSSKSSILTVKRNPLKCVDGCHSCEEACPMGVPILDEDVSGISNSLCINCGNCVDACPEAMSFTIRL